jgi:hypothetical protein
MNEYPHGADPSSMPVTVLDPGDVFAWGTYRYEVLGRTPSGDVLAKNLTTEEIVRVYPQLYVFVREVV